MVEQIGITGDLQVSPGPVCDAFNVVVIRAVVRESDYRESVTGFGF